MRPRRLIVVTGTGTEVGKTWVTARLVAEWRAHGHSVSVRKPAQSFDPIDAASGVTDAHLLAAAGRESVHDVCPERRWYPLPMAPPMAARALGRPVPTLATLVDEIDAAWPDPTGDIGIVEGAGGVASPLASDGDTAALCRAVDPDAVVLVAGAGLGTINLVRLSVSALSPTRICVHLNHFDAGNELHRLNQDWLARTDGFDVNTDVAALAGRLLAISRGRG